MTSSSLADAGSTRLKPTFTDTPDFSSRGKNPEPSAELIKWNRGAFSLHDTLQCILYSFPFITPRNPSFLKSVPLSDQNTKDRSFAPTMPPACSRAQRRGRGVLRGPVCKARRA